MIPKLAEALSLSVNELLNGEEMPQCENNEDDRICEKSAKRLTVINVVIIIAVSIISGSLLTFLIAVFNTGNAPNVFNSCVVYLRLIIFLILAAVWQRKYAPVYLLGTIYSVLEFIRTVGQRIWYLDWPIALSVATHFVPIIMLFIILYRRKGKKDA